MRREERVTPHPRVEHREPLRLHDPTCSACRRKRRQRPGVLFFALVSLLALAIPASDPLVAQAAPGRGGTIVVYKSQRRLFYFEDGILRRRFPITLGKQPEGEKRRRGDFRTPEGAYFVSSKRPRSRFLLFLGISYPNERDAEEGFHRGALSREDLENIGAAARAGREPSWDTGLGGFVGIHGEGSEYRGFVRRHHIDWTDGCIALSNEDIRDLYSLVYVGTPILILP